MGKGSGSSFGKSEAMPLGGVLVLLCTAASKVHPAGVVSVHYPVAGSESTGSAGDGRSALVGRAWRHTHDMMTHLGRVLGLLFISFCLWRMFS